MVDNGVMQPMIDEWGFMPDSATFRVVGHEAYIHLEPDDGGRKPPPWWVIGLVARILPSLRRKVKAAQRAVDTGLLESLPAQWRSELKPRLEHEIRDYATRDLTALADTALFEHLTELVAFGLRNMQLHFRLHMPHSVGVHELAMVCAELLGWDTPRAMELLQGLSVASSAPARGLAEIAALARSRPRALAVIESRPDDVVAALADIDPELTDRLRAYLQIWGIRLLGADAGRPSLGECPALFADALADLLSEDDRRAAVAERRQQRVKEARARLTHPGARDRFERALALAENTYPLREDNVILTDHLTGGLFRRLALEAGRRLVARGVLLRAADAVMLTADELRDAVVNGGDASAIQGIVTRRKGEHAWVRAHPGPAYFGPPPSPMPDVRGLPAAARRFNGAMLWEFEHELGAKQAAGDGIAGAAASPGIFRGRARVIRSAHDLGRLRPQEVLVCPETSSAWMMVFHRAGALVTDHGSSLSHSAIVAREFGLPAVVATGNATARLHDGDEVIVDGNAGTVTRG
jgi:pyruvate,water dikinase